MFLCPICRKYACPESPLSQKKTSKSKTLHIEINEYREHAGMTVKGNNYDVRVKKMNKNDQAFRCGLKKRDKLHSINGLRIKHHEQCIGIINQFTGKHRSFHVDISRNIFTILKSKLEKLNQKKVYRYES